MDEKTVDIFIPVVVNNIKRFPAALYSAITQTYENIRLIIFMDGVHEFLEEIISSWWYTPADNPRKNLVTKIFPRTGKPLIYEYCQRGVLIRNEYGPSGSAGLARQWLFEWEEKSKYTKMLDSDDILTPDAIRIMMTYMTPDVDAVFCPIVRCATYRLAETIRGYAKPGYAGSGCMLLKKEFMARCVKDGFCWSLKPGHDGAFLVYCEKNMKAATTQENMLYLYLKD